MCVSLKFEPGLTELEAIPALLGKSSAPKKSKKKSAKELANASAVFKLSKTSYASLLKNSARVWAVLSCAGGAAGCPEKAEVLEVLAKKLRGLVWCGIVDSKDEIVDDLDWSQRLAIFGAGRTKKEGEPSPYVGEEFDVAALEKWAVDRLPKREEGLSKDSFQVRPAPGPAPGSAGPRPLRGCYGGPRAEPWGALGQTFIQKIFGAGADAKPTPTVMVFTDEGVEHATEKVVAPMVRALMMSFPELKVRGARLPPPLCPVDTPWDTPRAPFSSVPCARTASIFPVPCSRRNRCRNFRFCPAADVVWCLTPPSPGRADGAVGRDRARGHELRRRAQEEGEAPHHAPHVPPGPRRPPRCGAPPAAPVPRRAPC
jgi:hypothetical protein